MTNEWQLSDRTDSREQHDAPTSGLTAIEELGEDKTSHSTSGQFLLFLSFLFSIIVDIFEHIICPRVLAYHCELLKTPLTDRIHIFNSK